MADNSEIFRGMVLNPDFIEYNPIWNRPFSFQTVFYKTLCSYRYCTCAYEHEYFDYISDTCEIGPRTGRNTHIDQTVFERIIQNIADGACSHAKEVEPKYLAISRVYPAHILTVGGSRDSLKEHGATWLSSGIFKLYLFDNFVLKNSCYISDLVKDFDHPIYRNL